MTTLHCVRFFPLFRQGGGLPFLNRSSYLLTLQRDKSLSHTNLRRNYISSSEEDNEEKKLFRDEFTKTRLALREDPDPTVPGFDHSRERLRSVLDQTDLSDSNTNAARRVPQEMESESDMEAFSSDPEKEHRFFDDVRGPRLNERPANHHFEKLFGPASHMHGVDALNALEEEASTVFEDNIQQSQYDDWKEAMKFMSTMNAHSNEEDFIRLVQKVGSHITDSDARIENYLNETTKDASNTRDYVLSLISEAEKIEKNTKTIETLKRENPQLDDFVNKEEDGWKEPSQILMKEPPSYKEWGEMNVNDQFDALMGMVDPSAIPQAQQLPPKALDLLKSVNDVRLGLSDVVKRTKHAPMAEPLHETTYEVLKRQAELAKVDRPEFGPNDEFQVSLGRPSLNPNSGEKDR